MSLQGEFGLSEDEKPETSGEIECKSPEPDPPPIEVIRNVLIYLVTIIVVFKTGLSFSADFFDLLLPEGARLSFYELKETVLSRFRFAGFLTLSCLVVVTFILFVKDMERILRWIIPIGTFFIVFIGSSFLKHLTLSRWFGFQSIPDIYYESAKFHHIPVSSFIVLFVMALYFLVFRRMKATSRLSTE